MPGRRGELSGRPSSRAPAYEGWPPRTGHGHPQPLPAHPHQPPERTAGTGSGGRGRHGRGVEIASGGGPRGTGPRASQSRSQRCWSQPSSCRASLADQESRHQRRLGRTQSDPLGPAADRSKSFVVLAGRVLPGGLQRAIVPARDEKNLGAGAAFSRKRGCHRQRWVARPQQLPADPPRAALRLRLLGRGIASDGSLASPLMPAAAGAGCAARAPTLPGRSPLPRRRRRRATASAPGARSPSRAAAQARPRGRGQ